MDDRFFWFSFIFLFIGILGFALLDRLTLFSQIPVRNIDPKGAFGVGGGPPLMPTQRPTITPIPTVTEITPELINPSNLY